MKVASGIGSFWKKCLIAFHMKLPRIVTVPCNCGHWYKMEQTQTPQVRPDPTVKAPLGSELAWVNSSLSLQLKAGPVEAAGTGQVRS